MPFIPGTHIKGVMRIEAERILRSIQGIDCWITGDLDMEDNKASKENPRKVKTCEALGKEDYGCDVCRVFGIPSGKGGKVYREGKIRVTNFGRVPKSLNRNSKR